MSLPATFPRSGITFGLLSPQFLVRPSSREDVESLLAGLPEINAHVAFCDADARFTDFFNISPSVPVQQLVGKRGDEVIDDEGQRLLTEVRRRVISTGKAEAIPMIALRGIEKPELAYYKVKCVCCDGTTVCRWSCRR